MDDEIVDSEENFSKMFSDLKGQLESDQELALHIMHKFNIDRDTMESMPAFNEHIEPLFSLKKLQYHFLLAHRSV